MTKIPKHIKKKLDKICYHQCRVKDLLEEIEAKYPELLYKEDEHGWSFSMNVDTQGEIIDPEQTEKLLIEFLEMDK
jgi:hypothetical protein